MSEMYVPAATIGVAWLLFIASHLGLSSSTLRARLVRQSGPRSFLIIYCAVTLVTMSGVIWAVATQGHMGAESTGAELSQASRTTLYIVSMLGMILVVAGLINFPRSAMAKLASRQGAPAKNQNTPLPAPSPIERVTRHPFFLGLCITMSAYIVLAPTLALSVYFAGFAFTAAIGIPLQDRKLRSRWPAPYKEHLTKSPIFPSPWRLWDGKGGVVPNLTPWIVSAAFTAFIFGYGHAFWATWNGAPFAIFILLFGLTGALFGLVQGSGKRQQN